MKIYVGYVGLKMPVFVELPSFQRLRSLYLTDEDYRALQNQLIEQPTAGAVIEGTGGLRKLRRPDPRRGKGKRGGLRVIYYHWFEGQQFWLFTLYDKDQADDLTAEQRQTIRLRLEAEKQHRQRS
jgi:hypothetical protein